MTKGESRWLRAAIHFAALIAFAFAVVTWPAQLAASRGAAVLAASSELARSSGRELRACKSAKLQLGDPRPSSERGVAHSALGPALPAGLGSFELAPAVAVGVVAFEALSRVDRSSLSVRPPARAPPV